MSKFKVGSTVRCVQPGTRLTVGRDYVVIQPPRGESDRIATFVVDDTGRRNGWLHNRFELVEEAPDNQHVAKLLLACIEGKPLKFRSGCSVEFVAYAPKAKPHCQLVLLNPATGNVVTRYANGKSSEEPYAEPGDIMVKEAA